MQMVVSISLMAGKVALRGRFGKGEAIAQEIGTFLAVQQRNFARARGTPRKTVYEARGTVLGLQSSDIALGRGTAAR
ncbi:hypothetical protein HB662_01070 [Roseomonas frigidaquae]|uniref:Uncharacterized protein n=1 Tax=Falsiroseomonas frigidaquae TaxID=487318 RepID=A0ABX1ES56_9PROT|nr:hypothetical protein [Falsiroseomonas frigidaquae]NKE43350.1 hypothetical protein [Falsiroseomonas frigidaquae]